MAEDRRSSGRPSTTCTRGTVLEKCSVDPRMRIGYVDGALPGVRDDVIDGIGTPLQAKLSVNDPPVREAGDDATHSALASCRTITAGVV